VPTSKKKKARSTRIFLVDDHPLVREGLIQCLQQEPDLTICGHAGNVADALRTIQADPPDLVIVDIALPGRDGLELIKELQYLHCSSLCMVLSMFEEELYAERALRAGAHGYVMKLEPPEKLIQSIRQVLAGHIVAGTTILQRALKSNVQRQAAQRVEPEQQLTDRELAVYRLIGLGRRRAAIATQLGISVKTFEAHRANIRKKLGLDSAGALMLRASRFVRDKA
jgi:DNA-binding NarL/FixJ family response regulator